MNVSVTEIQQLQLQQVGCRFCDRCGLATGLCQAGYQHLSRVYDAALGSNTQHVHHGAR